ncbi:MAG: hypothetical protein LBU32_11745 [Clostridiales bacterium]|jgi:hypothetical protein|nr:hypothetical protein [Clostridiales bacterium]
MKKETKVNKGGRPADFENVKSEAFFKALAKMYVKREGEELLAEFEEFKGNRNSASAINLDNKLGARRRRITRKKAIALVAPALAASIIAAVYLASPYTNFLKSQSAEPNLNAPQAVAPDYGISQNYAPIEASPTQITTVENPLEIESLSTRLPEGFKLIFTDYDRGQTIYCIQSIYKNEIILTLEKSVGKSWLDNMIPLSAGEKTAYGLVMNDYSLIRCEIGGEVYTLTSGYQTYDDLIKILDIL